MPEPKRPLKVFLCHASADKPAVRDLYKRLTADGVDVWLDKEKLLPGQDYEYEIQTAVRKSDVVIVCISKDFNKEGFKHKEVRWALDTAMEKPEGEIFIIPARLEECENLDNLKKWQWVDLFEEQGYERLIRALRARADKIGTTLQIKNSEFLKNAYQPKETHKATRQLPREKNIDSWALGILIAFVVFISISIDLFREKQTVVIQIIYNILNWRYFWIITTLCFLIDLVWMEKWKALFNRIIKLITKPSIFTTDEEPNYPRLYPRRFLEELATNSQRNRVLDSDISLKSIGYLVTLVLFVFLVFADSINVANILWLIGATSSVPDILQRLDLAFLGGVVFTVLTGVWALVESYDTSGLIISDSMSVGQKTLYKRIALTTIFISIVLMFSLAVQRLINVNFLVSTPANEMTLSFVSYGLLAVNTFLSAALVFMPATKGIFVLISILFFLIPIFAFVADIVWRLIYITIDSIIWMLLTPVMAILYVITKIINLLSIAEKNY